MSQDYHNPINFGASANAAVFNAPLGQLDQAIDDLRSAANGRAIRTLALGSPVEKTVVDGEITASRSSHTLQPESGTSDTLDTILGGFEGMELVLTTADVGDTITLADGTGNITFLNGHDFVLSSPTQTARLFYSVAAGGWVGFGSNLDGDFVHIETQTLLVAAASITVPSTGELPQIYNELEIEVIGRGTTAALVVVGRIRMNGDSGANYNEYYRTIANSAYVHTTNAGATSGYAGGATAATATATRFGAAKILLPEYASNSVQKVVQAIAAAFPSNTTTEFTEYEGSSIWLDTDPVTTLTLFPAAGNYDVGTQVILRGKS